jgi:hypothetical protein
VQTTHGDALIKLPWPRFLALRCAGEDQQGDDYDAEAFEAAGSAQGEPES